MTGRVSTARHFYMTTHNLLGFLECLLVTLVVHYVACVSVSTLI